MKKRGFIVLMTFIMGMSTIACSDKTDAKNKTTLYQKGVELTQKIDTLAESKDFMQIYTNMDGMSDIATEIGSQDYSKPAKVFKIVGFEKAILKTTLEASNIKLDPKVEEIVKTKFAYSISNMINSQKGAEFMAASACLTTGDSFLYKGLKDQTTYLFIYDGKYNSIVNYTPYKDNIVATSANILYCEEFTPDTTEADVKAYFKNNMQLENIDVKIVKK